MPPAPSPLKVGLLLDGTIVPAWTRRMLELTRALRNVHIEVAVLAERAASALGLRAALERRVIDAVSGGDDAFAPVDVADLLVGVPVLAAPRGDRPDEDLLRRIARLDLDVLLDLGSRAADGRILDVARHGVWSHWSESRPEGFWETTENRPVMRTALQQSTPKGTRTLYESTSAVDPTSVATTRNRAYWKTASFVPRVLNELHGSGEQAFLDRRAPAAATRPARRAAGAAAMTRFLAKRFIARRRAEVENKLYHEQWLLLFGLGPTAPDDYRRFKRLVPPHDRFWADPHVLHRDGRYYIFIEEYLYATHRAHLSVLVLTEDGNYSPPVPIITQPYHLSYPHVFTWRGETYLVPESKANRTIEIYRCTEFPYDWTLESRLMEDVDAVDATLLEHGGRWWLFANIVEHPGASSWDELHLFSADSPLSKTWTPHPQNPIVSDVMRARPAGRIFSRDGKLYRPSQNSGYRYGYGLNISEITELTESSYAERIVSRLAPTWDPEILGTHTFATERGLTVIDGLTWCRRRRWS
jgi:hypothetical protein